jgi:hypothetical protein
MPRELRLAVVAAFALFVSMFLPWYEKTGFVLRKDGKPISDSLSAFGAFSFVEAAVLLVAIGVIVLAFFRGERRAFHLPGGDGVVIMAAGGWVGLLLVYRLFDKPDASGNGLVGVTVGIQWGIFFALAAAAFLIYTGYRLHAAHRPEPPLPGEVRTERPPQRVQQTRATEPLIRDQRRATAATAAGRKSFPQGPPPEDVRAAADREAAGRGAGERAASERPPSGPLPQFERPAPDAPPEFPHGAAAPPQFPDTAELGRQAADDAPAEPEPERSAPDDDAAEETVAMPGRRRPRDVPEPDDPPKPPDTLF